MCGIAGIIQKNNPIDRQLFSKMLEAISHRGPEDQREWFDMSQKVALGHRRLAIIDLSEGGSQPRVSPDGRFVITFNGEIYNYLELKDELMQMGWKFDSGSDTEVLLYSFIQWQEKCLQKINGMFAFAIWDQQEKKLFAARDRLGEKPFKYVYTEEKFIFSSEIKGLLQDSTVSREIDWQAIDLAFSFRYVPSPGTGFKNIYKLPAGHYLTWQNSQVKVCCYWNPHTFLEIQENKSEEEWKKEVWNLFLDSVKHRLISDVAVGAFLSGGIDSTSVVAAISELGYSSVKTFVISVNGKSVDQEFAKKASQYFGTDHYEIEVKDINYESILDKLISCYDEPFFDQSALPSFLINQEIKKHVTVVLSGDGGDELFGGYKNHQFISFLSTYCKLPQLAREAVPYFLKPFKNYSYRAEILSKNFYDAYTNYCSLWKDHLPVSKKYLTKTDLYSIDFKNQINLSASAFYMKDWLGDVGLDRGNQAMAADIKGQLADGFLTKVDIAAMASSVEVRPPFLDYRLVEQSLRIPSSLKIKEKNTKYIWKQIVKDKIPDEIIWRPKVGFSIPLNTILKTDLKSIVEDTILSDSSSLLNYFSKKTIHKLWQDNLNNCADYSNHIWSLLILELWMKKYLGK